MNDEELKDTIKSYLKDNLTISVKTSRERDFGCEYNVVEVSLLLDDEVISYDTSIIFNS